MSDSMSTSEKGDFDQTALSALRLGLILLAVYGCYRIAAPFIPLVLWGAIIAVAIYPLHRKLATRLGDRNKLSATVITLLGLVILTTPVIILDRVAGDQQHGTCGGHLRGQRAGADTARAGSKAAPGG